MNARFTEKIYGLEGGQSYYIQLAIGEPLFNGNAQSKNRFNMLIDTGSSNEAVLGGCCQNYPTNVFICENSSTCVATTTPVNVKYASGSLTGHLVQDSFSGEGMGTVEGVKFIEIDAQSGFYHPGVDEFNGILGLAYPPIAQPQNNPPPSLMDLLLMRQNYDQVFGIQLCGVLQPLTTNATITNYHAGEWVVGGIDSPNGLKYYSGDIIYTPLIEEKWYVITVSDMAYGDISLNLDCHVYNTPQTIVDSGSTNLVLPSPVFTALKLQIQTATLSKIPTFPHGAFEIDSKCCTPDCTPSNVNSPLMSLPDITISLALKSGDSNNQHFTINIPPQYYWRPLQSNGALCRTLGISEGNQLILGDVFMDGLYIVHDRSQKKVGFSTATNCPNGAKSSKTVVLSPHSSNWCNCLSSSQRHNSLVVAYFPGQSACFFWQWWMYVILFSIIVILGSVAYMCYALIKMRQYKAKSRPTSYHNASDTQESFPHESNYAPGNSTTTSIYMDGVSSQKASTFNFDENGSFSLNSNASDKSKPIGNRFRSSTSHHRNLSERYSDYEGKSIDLDTIAGMDYEAFPEQKSISNDVANGGLV